MQERITFWPENSNQSWQHWSKLPSLSSILVVLSFLQQQAVFRSAFFPTFIALTYFRDHVKNPPLNLSLKSESTYCLFPQHGTPASALDLIGFSSSVYSVF